MASLLPYSLYFLFLFLLSLLFSSSVQSYTNIFLGSSLTASDDNTSWPSLSGEFVFGFQQIGNDQSFLLAIWFNKIPEKTVVWSANRNKLVQRGSKVELTEGGLLLKGPQGNHVWASDTAGGKVAYAAMLNNGNFMLASSKSAISWESFHRPTDTILPSQTLSQGSKLVAAADPGRFQFTLQSDGNLVLTTMTLPLNSVNTEYWSSNTQGSGFQLIFNQSGNIHLVAKNGTTVSILSSNAPSTQEFYHRAILENDGVFRHYVYPRDSSYNVAGWPARWSLFSSSIPSNICLGITEETGPGACGFNSYCTLGGDQGPNCKCPPGYSFLDPNDGMKGCKQQFVSQDCEEASQGADRFYLEVKENTDWPRSDYAYFKIVTEDWCRKACLSDCFCAVAIFRNGECWKKKIPLSNGRFDPSIGGKALIKVRKDNSSSEPEDNGASKSKDRSTVIFIGSLLLSSSASLNFLLLLAACLAVFHFSYRRTKKLQEATMEGINLRSFTYNELEHATDKFKEELGRGAFAIVYKGVLAFGSRTFVAVKNLDKMVTENDKEFKAELFAIGRTNHKNLVQLLGFCNEGEHRLLVYEFIRNGNLAKFLFGSSSPVWYKRIQIAFGVARGLYYLHEECSTQIIHCDIKPQNILLDDSFTPRISDFGLAKLLKTDQTRTTTAIRGTKGYVAPEWFRNQPISVKVDVYSFGTLLLELICCRKNFEAEVKDENQMILTDWAYDCYKEGEVNLLVENDEEAMLDLKRVERFVMVAIWCIQEDPALRPTMKKVTQMLEGTVEVSIPPDPSSFISSI